METGTLIAWLGNACLFAGVYLAGRKWRHAFGFTFVGDVLWLVESVNIGRLDWFLPCFVFAALAARNWYCWCKDANMADARPTDSQTRVAEQTRLRPDVAAAPQDEARTKPPVRGSRAWRPMREGSD